MKFPGWGWWWWRWSGRAASPPGIVKSKDISDICNTYHSRYSIDHLGPAPGLGGLLLLQQRHEVLYRLLAHGHALLVAAGVLACSTQWYARSTLLQVKYKVVIIKLYLEHTATEWCYIPWSFAGLVCPAAPCNTALSIMVFCRSCVYFGW